MIAKEIVSMHICQHFQTLTYISRKYTTNVLYRDWILFIELTTTRGTIGMEASCRQSFFEIQRETTESERYWQQLFTM